MSNQMMWCLIVPIAFWISAKAVAILINGYLDLKAFSEGEDEEFY